MRMMNADNEEVVSGGGEKECKEYQVGEDGCLCCLLTKRVTRLRHVIPIYLYTRSKRASAINYTNGCNMLLTQIINNVCKH